MCIFCNHVLKFLLCKKYYVKIKLQITIQCNYITFISFKFYSFKNKSAYVPIINGNGLEIFYTRGRRQ